MNAHAHYDDDVFTHDHCFPQRFLPAIEVFFVNKFCLRDALDEKRIPPNTNLTLTVVMMRERVSPRSFDETNFNLSIS